MDEQQGVTDTAKVDPKLEKIRKFGEDPDKFICIDDIIIAVMKNGTYIGNCTRGEYKAAWAEVNFKIMNRLMLMEMQMIKEKSESEIKVVGSHNGAPLFGRR